MFYPESIAIVGASRDVRKTGYGWTKGLIDVGFNGSIYPVNPNGGELLGLKIYSNLKEIPGTIDYVIVTIPREAIPNLLDDCAAKKAKVIHFFTAGFNEIGDTASHKLEDELRKKVYQNAFQIIGPNCIGAYCPEHKLPYGPGGMIGKNGEVGFIAQSGGVGAKLVELGMAQGIKYSKGISFGNGIILDSTDFLKYMAADPKTSTIGAYLEGSRDSRRLFNTIKESTKTKPVIIWKGGRTDVGATAARSHTGALASPAAIWSAALKQANAIEVSSLEELADTLLIFQQLHQWQGKGVAVVGGLADGGGGISVAAGDACSELGLNIPPLSIQTIQKLANLLGQIGSILGNPVDISQGGSKPHIIREAMKLVLADPSIDLVIIQEDVGILLSILPKEQVEEINNIFLDLITEQSKPLVLVLPSGVSEPERLQIESKFCQASIPVFTNMERATKAIMNLSQYSLYKTTKEG